MKHFQRIILMMMCVVMLGSLTGCGNNDAADNGAANSATEGTENKENASQDIMDETGDEENRTDDSNRGGVVEDIGDEVQDGIDNVEDAMDGKDKSHTDTNAGTDSNADQNANNTTENATNR